jgi:hypothetical protein
MTDTMTPESGTGAGPESGFDRAQEISYKAVNPNYEGGVKSEVPGVIINNAEQASTVAEARAGVDAATQASPEASQPVAETPVAAPAITEVPEPDGFVAKLLHRFGRAFRKQ